MRPRHPDKEVELAILHAEATGWTCMKRDGKGHCWGILRCPHNDAKCRCGEFCQLSVWSTPRNGGNHARQIVRRVDGCIHANKGPSP